MRAKQTTITDQTVEKRIVENRWDRMMIVLACFLLFVGAVLAGVSTWQGTQRNRKIDHIDQVVTEAKTAAEDARQAVHDAVAAQQSPENKQLMNSFIASLAKIDEIKRTVDQLAAKQ